MSLNPMYVIASGLDEYFVDKDTGLPLSGGILNFFVDSNRSVPKNVFTISGTPPNYSYINLGSTITLNGTGNPADEMGNNIVIYYFPYDANGNVELYYIEVIAADSTPQFTREGWPNISDVTPDEEALNIDNFIPNGQFLAHNNIPATSTNGMVAGKISGPITSIAPGGWSYQRPNASTATDIVTFFRFGAYVFNPTSSPRYAVQLQCLSASLADAYKDIRVRFNDVNKFGSDTQEYTFCFTAAANTNFNVNLFLIKNFGTGGSSSTQLQVNTSAFAITPSFTLFQCSFIFGNNIGKTIGNLNDDYLELAIRFPTSITFIAQLTDFVLTTGAVTLTVFPQQTDRDFIGRSLVATVPDPNGFNLALPLILTKDGLGYDTSQIGKIYATSTPVPAMGELLCDGTSYLTNGYSSDGIPYARLQQVLIQIAPYANPWGMPIFGTGTQFVNTISSSILTNTLIFSTNKVGTFSATANGSPSPGFNVSTAILGNPSANTYGFTSFVYGNGSSLWVLCNSDGYCATVSPASSGFTINTVNGNNPANNSLNPNIGERIGTSVSQQLVNVTVTALPAAGTYFVVSNPTTAFYVWFKINGVGTDPLVVGATGIPVNLLSSISVSDAAYIIANALSGFQVSMIQTVAGSSIPANSYFTFYSNSQLYYVWYSLNGAGTDPAVAGGIGIPVSYTTSDSNVAICFNTIFAMNSAYFGTPNMAGLTIKGWDTTGAVDQNYALRYYNNQFGAPYVNLPGFIGSLQFDQNLSHQHDMGNYTSTGIYNDYTSSTGSSTFVATRGLVLSSGTGQNDVKNIYLNYVIKY